MPAGKAERRRRRWYLRPFPVVTILLALVLTVATVPPLMASPTDVALNEQGKQNAQKDGWEEVALGAQATMEIAGGLVTLQTEAMQTNDENGYPVAGYSWATVKIPAMLPRDLVEDRLREEAVGIVQDILHDLSLEREDASGILLDTTPVSDTTFTGNGHDTRLTRYQASARLSEQLPASIRVDHDATLNGEAFIATWRCSILGSYALAFAVARDEPDLEKTIGSATPDSSEGLDGLDDLDDDELAKALEEFEDPDGSDLDHEDLLDDIELDVGEVHLARTGSDHLDHIMDRLLANTVCAG